MAWALAAQNVLSFLKLDRQASTYHTFGPPSWKC